MSHIPPLPDPPLWGTELVPNLLGLGHCTLCCVYTTSKGGEMVLPGFACRVLECQGTEKAAFQLWMGEQAWGSV